MSRDGNFAFRIYPAVQSDIGKQQWVTGFHCVCEVLIVYQDGNYLYPGHLTIEVKLFIILLYTKLHFLWQSINQVAIVLGIHNFGYRMPKVIRHLLAKDSTGQTVQWWKMSNKWLDNICQSILPLTQNWTGKNDDDDEPLQKGYLRLNEVRSQIRRRTAQKLEGYF